jgi:hypothetical protein
MATENVTPIRPRRPSARRTLFVKGRLAVPHDGVKFRLKFLGDGDIYVEYSGFTEELIACGAATPELLGPAVRGKTRSDSAGNHVILARRKNHRLVCRTLQSRDAVAQLLGVTAAGIADAVKVYEQRFPPTRQADARAATLAGLMEQRARFIVTKFLRVWEELDEAGKERVYHLALGELALKSQEESERIAERRATPSHLRLVVDNTVQP